MGIFLSNVGQAIEECDLFAAPVLLRYKTQEDKKSKIGGFISIVLVTVLLAAFSNQWISLFRKADIQSNSVTIRDMDPTNIQINSENFVVAIGFITIDTFAKVNKYLDLLVTYEVRNNGKVVETIPIDMIPCQPRHFSHFGSNFEELYTKQMLNNCLCWPDNFSVNITGKFSSAVFTYIHVQVKKCTTNCVSQTQFQDHLNKNGGFPIDYYFVNKLVNPTLVQPISYYFEDKNYDIINDKLATTTNIYLSQYQIQTDESLLPFEDIQTNTGIFVDRTEKEVLVHSVESGSFANFHFRKSDQKIKVTRSFRKIDDLFSYIGGLFGILAAGFGLIIMHYNKCCYELQMSNKIFKNEEPENNQEDITELREAIHCNKGALDPKENKTVKEQDINFNFLTYLKYIFAEVIFLICPNFNWATMKSIKNKREQTQNQMNVDVILQKIFYYERAFQCLFNSNQITLLMLQQKVSISELKEQRTIMNLQDEVFMPTYNKTAEKSKNNRIFNLYNAQQFDQKSKSNTEQTQNNQMMLQIYEAIEDIKKKSNKNEVCKKILLGLREDLKLKFEEYLKKSKGKNIPRRSSAFSKFILSGKKILDNPNQSNSYNIQFPIRILRPSLTKRDSVLTHSANSFISQIEMQFSNDTHRDQK